MASTMKQLGIDRLSVAERIDLALEIWESVAPDLVNPGLTPEQSDELRRRDAELDAYPGIGLTWDEFSATVRGSQ